MIKRSRTQKRVGSKGASTGRNGLISIVFEVTPEVKARIEKCARRANMSVSEAGGVLLEFELNKKEALEEIIQGKVQKAIDETVDRIESLIEPMLSPPLPKKGRKEFSN